MGETAERRKKIIYHSPFVTYRVNDQLQMTNGEGKELIANACCR
jgi:hypothetical protein